MKYEMTDNTQVVNGETLTQIRALRDIGDHTKAGDLGGWIAEEYTLSSFGDCWIDTNVKMCYGSFISGNAYITGDSIISGYSNIGDNVYIDADVTIRTEGIIKGNARIASDDPNVRIQLTIKSLYIFDNAIINQSVVSRHPVTIKGNVTVDCPLNLNESLIIDGNETILIPPTAFMDLWPVSITPKYISIGCQHHTAEEWWSFDDATIHKMHRIQALAWWKANKETIRNLHNDQVEALNKLQPQSN